MCTQLKQNKNVNVCLKMNCAFIISITLFLQLIVLHRKLAQGLNYCSPQNFHSVWRTENKLQHLSDMPFFVFVSGILSCSLSWNRHHLAELPWVDFWLGLFWSGCRLREKKLDGQLLHAGIRLIWRLCYGYMMLMLVSCQVDSTCVAYLAWWLMYASIACTLLHLDQPLAPPVIVTVTSRRWLFNRRDAS